MNETLNEAAKLAVSRAISLLKQSNGVGAPGGQEAAQLLTAAAVAAVAARVVLLGARSTRATSLFARLPRLWGLLSRQDDVGVVGGSN